MRQNVKLPGRNSFIPDLAEEDINFDKCVFTTDFQKLFIFLPSS